jgi:RNA polymerase sigma-70 factor, ECF subfamily
MRQVLVDHARAKCAEKRGGANIRIEFKESIDYSDDNAANMVAIDDALSTLATLGERKARTIELRYFGGLTVEETAEALGISAATVVRETRYAEAWLRRQLTNTEHLREIS